MSASTNPEETPLDLDLLQSLNIGPDWATSSAPQPTVTPRDYGDERELRGQGRDRRPPRDRRDFSREGSGGGGERSDRRERGFPPRRDFPPRREGGEQHGPKHQHGETSSPHRHSDGIQPRHHGDGFTARRHGESFQPRHHGDFPKPQGRPRPVVEISFFPEDKPFSVLIGAIKTSLRTYELFEIAHLFLDKGDRFLVGCRPFDAENDPAAQLYQAVPDQLPFLSESDAVAHVMQRHLELFFTQESVTVDPPKGIFQMVSKCGFTGEILGAPNYHGYQQRLREHHAARLAYLPFEKFTSRIESVRDKEQIDAWLKSMTQITRYTLKDAREGEPTQFDSLESARAFLLASRRDKVVRVVRQMRFPGKFLDTLPSGPLRSAIESELRYQRNFPLATANSLRGRLRKIGLVLYKRGSHEVTYVSAVERKFREPQIRFADSIQRVLDFIEKTPRVKIADLPEKFLGISLAETKAAPANKAGANTPGPEAEATAPQTAPETSPSAELAETQTEQLSVEALVGTASEATAIAPVEISGEAPPTPEAATAAVEDAPAEKVEPASSDETSSADAPAEAAPEAPALPGPEATAVEVSTALAPDSPAPALGAKAGPVPQPTLDLLASNAVRELFKTVRWLVSEGYVTEYSDGRLYAHPVLTEAQIKARTMAVQEPRKHDGKKRGNNTPTAPDVLDALGTADQDEEPTTDQFKTASLES